MRSRSLETQRPYSTRSPTSARIPSGNPASSPPKGRHSTDTPSAPKVFPYYYVQIHDMIAEGDQVVVEWSHRGVHRGPYDGIPPTGKTITGRAISIYRVIDGRITDARGIWDRGEVLEQLAVISRTDKVRGT
jgi:ketosteroid isomerase-like protein